MKKIENEGLKTASKTFTPPLSPLFIDQVIGQPEAVQAIRQAAHRHRNVLLIGQPGTGKSMLAKALAELLPQKSPPDILVFPNPENLHHPRILTVPAGRGIKIVEHHRQKVQSENLKRLILVNGIALTILLGAVLLSFWPGPMDPTILFFGIVTTISWLILQNFVQQKQTKLSPPCLLIDNSSTQDVPFVDASGATAGALLGDIRHDPFQSGGLETPPHELVVPGLVHKASGGVLLIDEIGTLDLDTQFKLLTILQERKYPIEGQSETSSGSTVRTTPAPCDFILVAAGNLETLQMLHPALRSRFQGFGKEILMNETIPDDSRAIVLFEQFVKQEVAKDGKIPSFTTDSVNEIINEARLRSTLKNHLSLRLRDLGGVIRAAGDIASLAGKEVVELEDVQRARKQALPLEVQISHQVVNRSKEYKYSLSRRPKIGQTVALALFGDQGVLCPIVAITQSFLEGNSQFEASCQHPEIISRLARDAWVMLSQIPNWPQQKAYRITVQILDFPQLAEDCFGLAIAVALYSAVNQIPISPKIVFLGRIAINGEVLPVSRLNQRLAILRIAEVNRIIVPEGNLDEIERIFHGNRKKPVVCGVSSFSDILERKLFNYEEKMRE